MKIVIIGASGNVGTALLHELGSTDQDLQIVGVSRRRPPDVAPYDAVQWETLDIADDGAQATLTRILENTDCVVNLAWGFQPARNISYLDRVGIGGTQAVLAAARSAQVTHLIQMSSVGAYSPARRGIPVDEDWPTGGVPTSAYSREKAAVESILADHVKTDEAPLVCALRPGLIMQRSVGSALLRYALPAWLPSAALDLVPLLPLDRSFAVPVVHTPDVARAVALAIEKVAVGAYNLAAPSPLTPEVLSQVLRARQVHVPWRALRALVSLSWTTRLQRLDPGWIDLAFAVPLLDCSRALDELGWRPALDAPAVIREAVTGMRRHLSGSSATLRRRTVLRELAAMLRRGPVTRRRLP